MRGQQLELVEHDESALLAGELADGGERRLPAGQWLRGEQLVAPDARELAAEVAQLVERDRRGGLEVQ
ncbi:MAG: hypothetical protein ACRD0K_24690 [Egibacteraceae bacterium]